MKYVQILASTFAFVAAAALLVQMRQQQAHLYLFVVLFLLCGANLLSRLTETSINDQIAEAEEKVAKRVLRRLAKVMPELLNEYFKAQALKPAEKLSDVVVATREVIRESAELKQDTSKGIYVCVFCHKQISGGAMMGAGDGTGERFAHPECYEAGCSKK